MNLKKSTLIKPLLQQPVLQRSAQTALLKIMRTSCPCQSMTFLIQMSSKVVSLLYYILKYGGQVVVTW